MKNDIDSKSYAIIKCREDANPKFNRLQLRTEQPTFIELQPGENILKVEDYPALKYGFSQISENDENNPDKTMSHCPIENCQDVLSIDLNNFDGSDMTSMDEMFYSMQNLKDIDFDRLDTSNVVSMVDTFRLTGKEGKLTIDFNTAKVRDISGMLASTWYDVIELKGLDLSKVKNAEQAFDSVPLLIIDNVKLGNADIKGFFLNVPDKVIIINCDQDSISKIIEDAIECEGDEILKKMEIKEMEDFEIVDDTEDDDLKDISFDNLGLEDAESTTFNSIDTSAVESMGKIYEEKPIPVYKDDFNVSYSSGVLVSAPENLKGTYIVRPGTKHIREKAFKDCKESISIELPDSLKSIGDQSFENCRSLVSINLPTNLTHIGSKAFSHCTSLNETIIPDGIEKLEDSTFFGCSNLINIQLPSSLLEIGEGAFDFCGSLKTIKLPDFLNVIGKTAFQFCNSLKEIELPISIKELGDQAFCRCENLSKVIIRGDLQKIGHMVFFECKRLREVNIEGKIAITGHSMFSGCISLEEVILPESLQILNYDTFGDCLSLNEIVLPESLEEIKSAAFFGCQYLRSIIFKGRVNEVDKKAFHNCKSLESIFVPSQFIDYYKELMPYFSEIIFSIDDYSKIKENKRIEFEAIRKEGSLLDARGVVDLMKQLITTKKDKHNKPVLIWCDFPVFLKKKASFGDLDSWVDDLSRKNYPFIADGDELWYIEEPSIYYEKYYIPQTAVHRIKLLLFSISYNENLDSCGEEDKFHKIRQQYYITDKNILLLCHIDQKEKITKEQKDFINANFKVYEALDKFPY